MRESMTHSITSAAEFLVENLALLKDLHYEHGVLDLACGSGRNGLLLADLNIPVVFADNNRAAIELLQGYLVQRELPGECWLVDLEAGSQDPLQSRCFDAVLAFNYLHRPLLKSLKRAIRGGGIIMYETFTVKQPEFGRPTNPDFLLQEQELLNCFSDWKILHYYEGIVANPTRASARLIARKRAARQNYRPRR